MHDRKFQDFDENHPEPEPEDVTTTVPLRNVARHVDAGAVRRGDDGVVDAAAVVPSPPVDYRSVSASESHEQVGARFAATAAPTDSLPPSISPSHSPSHSPLLRGWRVVDWRRVYSGAARAVRYAAIAVGVWLCLMVLLIAAFGFLAPPGSALMTLRWMQGQKIDQRWVAIERMSPNLVRAVIVSEDGRFCRHWGIDPKEIMEAIRRSRNGVPRGASTITMQLSKNLFLWPSKSYLRKALEVPLTLAIELLWSKRRIMEVYLNVVEWGPGVFGAQAAARHHFKIPASRLSAKQASLLAVSLPNPIRRRAGRPSRHVERVSRVVRARMRRGTRLADCVLGRK